MAEITKDLRGGVTLTIRRTTHATGLEASRTDRVQWARMIKAAGFCCEALRSHAGVVGHDSYEAMKRKVQSARKSLAKSRPGGTLVELVLDHKRTGVTRVYNTRNREFMSLKELSQELKYLKTGLLDDVRYQREEKRAVHGPSRRWKTGRILKELKAKKRTGIGQGRGPKCDAEHVGIEIEFFIPSDNNDQIIDGLLESGLDQYCQFKDDGSLHSYTDDDGDRYEGYEIAFVAPVHIYKPLLTELCDLITVNDGYVTKECGLHVHMDCRQLLNDKGELNRVVNNFVACQPLLYSMQPKGRRSNSYCRRVQSRNMIRRSGRYYGINTSNLYGYHSKKNTVELRMHTGTTNPLKIIAWVDLLLSIKRAPKIAENVRVLNAKRLSEVIGVVPHVLEYVKMRLKKFKPAPKPRPARVVSPEPVVTGQGLSPAQSIADGIALNRLAQQQRDEFNNDPANRIEPTARQMEEFDNSVTE